MIKTTILKKYLGLFLICLPLFIYPTTDDLYNKWFLEKSLLCNENTVIDDTKWAIEFHQNGLAELSFSNIKGKMELNYLFENNEIIINEQKYAIDTLMEDSLILINYVDDVCRKLFFKSEKGMIDNQLKKHVMYNNEPVYFANEFNHPNLEGNDDLNEYFKSAYLQYTVEQDYCDIKFIFIVTKDGNLEKEQGSFSCKKKSDKIIKKIFEGTKNKWQPMLINNKPVNTYVEVKFQIKFNRRVIDPSYNQKLPYLHGQFRKIGM